MAYDEQLAERIRALLSDEPDLTERRMFGGLAFLLRGSMAIAASRDGIMVRVDPDATDELLDTTDAEPMVMRDREISGWVRVTDTQVADDTELAAWVERGRAYVRTLPPK